MNNPYQAQIDLLKLRLTVAEELLIKCRAALAAQESETRAGGPVHADIIAEIDTCLL